MKITPIQYARALAQILGRSENAKAIIANFLSLLRRRKQFRLLPKILRAFENEWASRRGLIKMRVTYPVNFKETLDDLEKRLSTKLGKSIEFTSFPSNTLIGGFRLYMGDTLIDGSIETMLSNLEKRLNSIYPLSHT